MRNKKKILGIAILAIIVLIISGTVFSVVLWATLCAGFSVGISILISLSPFVGIVVIGGPLKIGLDLAFFSEDNEMKKSNKTRGDR